MTHDQRLAPGRPPDGLRRSATRGRICAVAADLFRRCGYSAVTMEQIAKDAAIRRSTLYTHFPDKDAILAAVAGELLPKVTAQMALLPGPVPTRAQVDAWFDRCAEVISQWPAIAEIVMATGHLDVPPPASRHFGQEMMAALAVRIDAFARALRAGETLQRAWAEATLREFGFAMTYHAKDPQDPMARERLRVAAAIFLHFVRLDTPDDGGDTSAASDQ